MRNRAKNQKIRALVDEAIHSNHIDANYGGWFVNRMKELGYNESRILYEWCKTNGSSASHIGNLFRKLLKEKVQQDVAVQRTTA